VACIWARTFSSALSALILFKTILGLAAQQRQFNEAVIFSAEGATGLKPGVERSGAPGMGMVCEQALQPRLEIRFGVALCRAYLLAPSALVRS